MDEETDLIELTVLRHMKGEMDCPVYVEFPEKDVPERFLLLDKAEGSLEEHIQGAMILVQSYGPSKLEAALLNETAKEAMMKLEELPGIASVELNSDYPFFDEKRKRHRYQAVFDITYY